ncbi:MAG: hypothetical protein WAK57_19745 [Desulfobacterales bacterium]
MRVATYNVHDCAGRDGRFDPGRIIEVLTEICADLVALQEIMLDRVGQLVGHFEKATLLVAIDSRLAESGVGSYGNPVWPHDRLGNGCDLPRTQTALKRRSA